MAARRYEISLRLLKNISRVSARYQVFARKLTWYFIGVYIIKANNSTYLFLLKSVKTAHHADVQLLAILKVATQYFRSTDL